ncbi:MAG TPA: hypothetical protein VN541_15870 [Tepidisphaeraceae bacterium]|nr:hypothetical protein [Tepidisphaeraceae bacterium]
MPVRPWHRIRIKRHWSSQGAKPSRRLEPAVVREARHSDFPDVSTYDRPATTRMTTANLGLSICLLLGALIIFGGILWALLR